MGSPKIVLTASSTEASEFKHSVWQQMLSATIPFKYSKTFINQASLENESWPDGRAKYVPNGLRMVETLLLRDYSEDDVVVCYVENLHRFVGPETKVVAIHAHNPLGISYATDVYSKLGGENLMPLNAHEFLRIVTHPVLKQYAPKIVVGGPGGWQLEKADRLDEFKIDYLIDGEIEHVFSELFRRIIAGDPSLERIIKIPKAMQPSVDEIPVVRHRSTFGVVEITRGCGRGCQFCSPATKVGRSFPLEHIVESTRVNVEEGATEVMLTSEDMFLYEQLPNFGTNVPAMEKMFKAVLSVPGLETIQLTHITMAPVVKDPTVIERLTPLCVPYSHLTHEDSTDPDKKIVDPIIGLETGSPRLFDQYMKGKAYPYKAYQWRDVVLKGMEILNRHNWYPFNTFIIGLPEDDEAALDRTLHFALELDLDFMSLNMAVPRFGTPFRADALARGLAREDDPKLEALITRSSQTEKSDSVRLAQTFAFYRMGKPGMMSVIVQAMSNRSQRDQAAQYIREAKTAMDILPFLRVEDQDAQLVVVDALGLLGDQSTVDALKPLVRGASPDVALAADRSIRLIE